MFYRPDVLLERLALALKRRGRLAQLRGTCASGLKLGHIDSLEFLQLLSRRGVECVYDIGANVGTWTLLAKAILPQSTVEAFEPYQPHVEQFQRNTAALEGVRLHPVMLGSRRGTQILNITQFSDASSVLRPVDGEAPDLHVVAQVEAPEWRLDDYQREQNLPWPDLIKMDVQGYELEVLQGAAECLGHAAAVITEVSFVTFYKNQCLFHDVVRELAKYDLLVAAFGPYTPAGAPVKQTDVLFLKGRQGFSVRKETR